MPLIYYKTPQNTEVALWKATENIDFFEDELNAQDFPTQPGLSIAHPEKQLQWFASRFLLCKIYPAAIPLYRNRKPFLLNGPQVSFSHSKNIVAIQISTFKSGIDIQWPDPKLKVLSGRFLAPRDLKNTPAKNELEALCIIWSIKESVFKYYGTQMPFKKIEIDIYDPVLKTAVATAHRNGKTQQHRLVVDFIEDMCLAYITE